MTKPRAGSFGAPKVRGFHVSEVGLELISDPDFIECRFHVREQHLCANAVWCPRPYANQFIGSRRQRSIWHRVRERRLSSVTRQHVSPTRNELVIWLIPTQLRNDFLSDVYCSKVYEPKKLTLPMHERSHGDDALRVRRRMVEDEEPLHVIS